MRARATGGGVLRALVVLTMAAFVVAADVAPAAAATSTGVHYSTDGGASWSSSVTVAPGATVLVRQRFDNTGTGPEDDATVATSLPAGLTLVAGTTRVCLDPSSGGPSAPAGPEASCAAVDDGSVWSGANLAVSPSAGHFGFPSGATSGVLAPGRPRFLNVHQCVHEYLAQPAYRYTSTQVLDRADGSGVANRSGTTVSNSADSGAPTCEFGVWPGSPVLAKGGIQAFDLLANRYLNLGQCRWVDADGWSTTSFIDTTAGADWRVGSNTSDVAAPVSCPSVAGQTSSPAASGSASFDILENRYLNLGLCRWGGGAAGSYTILLDGGDPASFDSPTAAANTAGVAGAACATSPDVATYPYLIGLGYEQTIDLLDATRGEGYVTYEVTAPTTVTPARCVASPTVASERFDQTGTLSSSPSGTTSGTGAITVQWPPGSKPCPGNGGPVVDPGVAVVGIAIAGSVARRRRRAPAR